MPSLPRAVPSRIGEPGWVAAGVLLLTVVAAAWWSAALVPAAVSAYLLGRWAVPRRVLVGCSLAGALAAVLVRTLQRGQPLLLVAAVVGLVVVVVVADGLGRLTLARVRYREQGWQLAEALRERELAVTDAARTAERSRIAGEMHDSLGHDMALLALQLAALQVQAGHGDLSSRCLAGRLTALRSEAAAATERLHEVIGLLEPPDRSGTAGPPHAVVPSGPTGEGPWTSSLESLLQRAGNAGMVVDLDGTWSGLDRCSRVVGHTVLRVVEEALTNTAKHAPGAPLRLGIEVGEHAARVLATNPRAGAAPRRGGDHETAAGSGRGLSRLAERTRALGGSWLVDEGPTEFRLQATIPTRPSPAGAGSMEDPIEPAVSRTRSRDVVTRRRRSVVLLPATLLAVTTVLLVLAFVAVNLASVLPRERFAALQVGQSARAAEALLPPVQMPDAPQTVAQASSDCRYYEERLSFFERVTTFQVCFADGGVVATTEIPARRSR